MGRNDASILIAGGGIGGLTAALSLLQRGIDVKVFEQASQLKEIGAGVQISPNGSRVLQELGLLDQIRESACRPRSKEIRLWDTGQRWTLLELGETAVQRFGFPYVTVYRVDLHNALVDAVRALKADAIELAAPCAGLDQDAQGVTLYLKGGRSVRGAALIGADGINSTVRQTLFGADRTSIAEMQVWRGVIPMAQVPAHLREPIGAIWLGPGAHVVHYPLRNHTLMNFGGCLEKPMALAQSSGVPGSVADCLADFCGWHPDVLSLIGGLQAPIRWGVLRRPLTESWTVGRVTLLGDACHAMFPFLAQGAVMAMEDGLVLARCLEQDDRIEPALQRYERARKDRTYAVAEGAAANAGRFHSPQFADPLAGARHIDQEWTAQKVSARYDWVFDYDAASVAL